MNETDAGGPLHPSLCNLSLLISGFSNKSHTLYENPSSVPGDVIMPVKALNTVPHSRGAW